MGDVIDFVKDMEKLTEKYHRLFRCFSVMIVDDGTILNFGEEVILMEDYNLDIYVEKGNAWKFLVRGEGLTGWALIKDGDNAYFVFVVLSRPGCSK